MPINESTSKNGASTLKNLVFCLTISLCTGNTGVDL